MGSIMRATRFGVVGVGVALALGGTAAPVMAVTQPAAGVVQAQAALAPAPTGLAYTYDAASQTVTVTWDAKTPDDTVTINYRIGNCGPTPQYPCFVAPNVIREGHFSFKMTPGSSPRYIKIYAENAAHQLTRSQVLTVTV
ncbi:hypothetical protein ACFVTY_09340 [Streptomyces sp. NPDC058067]|uniref:hypothetical protein n=1 Tax=Streptomyces sp. NPDC058067 TaxID=3346324 RepID=UPI0036E25226